MKLLVILFVTLLLSACTEADVEELTFRKVMEYDLIKLCEDDEQCKQDLKSQIKGCLVSSDRRKYVDNDDDEEEFVRFTETFYAFIVDSEGNPYFEVKLD